MFSVNLASLSLLQILLVHFVKRTWHLCGQGEHSVQSVEPGTFVETWAAPWDARCWSCILPVAVTNGQLILLQNQLFLGCSPIRAQRRFTMKGVMSWSHRSGGQTPPWAPQLLPPVLRNNPRKGNLSPALQNQNPCRTAQSPAQLQRSVWKSPLPPVPSSQKGINALLRAPVKLHSLPSKVTCIHQ